MIFIDMKNTLPLQSLQRHKNNTKTTLNVLVFVKNFYEVVGKAMYPTWLLYIII